MARLSPAPLTSFLLLATALPRLATALCYTPAGNISNDQPCNPLAEVSTCCELGYFCTSNNLCLPTQNKNDSDVSANNMYIRGTCTSKDWGPECAPICLAANPTEGDVVWRCEGDRYCCGQTYCCDQSVTKYDLGFPSLTATVVVGVLSSTSSSSSSSTTGSATPTPTNSVEIPSGTMTAPSSTTPSSTSSPQTSESDSGGGVKASSIGIGVGVGVGVAALVAGAVAFFCWRRKRRGAAGAGGGYVNPKDQGHEEAYGEQFSGYEVSADSQPVELHAGREPVEVGGVVKYAHVGTRPVEMP